MATEPMSTPDARLELAATPEAVRDARARPRVRRRAIRVAKIPGTVLVAWLLAAYVILATLFGRNREGDPDVTDGELSVGVLVGVTARAEAPLRDPNPPLVRMKGQLWTAIRPFLAGTGG